MRKRIAVFASGWAGEFIKEVMSGMKKAATKADTDIFFFTNFSVFTERKELNVGEVNIFNLPDLKDFDGVVVMPNSFNTQEEMDALMGKLKACKLPIVSIEYKVENATAIMIDNYSGMEELVRHVIEEHGAREIVYVGGLPDHSENIERLKALCDVAGQNNLSILDENVLGGEWSKNPAKLAVQNWVLEKGHLPDAFICANDIMALGVCEWLSENDYDVPKDTIVTGYDCIQEAQENIPSITSVNHEWSTMGKMAVDLVLEMITTGQKAQDKVLKSRFVKGESCGCQSEFRGRYTSYELGRAEGRSKADWMDIDSHFRHFYLAVRRVENLPGLISGLSYLFNENHKIEGDKFMLCLDPAFSQVEETDENLYMKGYPSEVDVVVSLCEGKTEKLFRQPTKEMIFNKAKRSEKPGIYTFVPLYSETRTYGFSVLSGTACFSEDKQLYIWTRHMNQYLEQVRRNIRLADLNRKLAQLSVTDVLTGVYNRAGCEQVAYPMLTDWQANGGTGVLMIVDIDRMKTINDRFGHSSGDLAIRTVATVLKTSLPEDWIVSRFGGDEFLVGGKLENPDMDITTIEDTIMERLAAEVETREITFRLSVSIGSVKVVPGGETDVEKLLQTADENMYSVKSRHHEAIDRMN